MDTLHTVLRGLRGKSRTERSHLDVFREFLAHLDRIGRAPQRPARAKSSASPRPRPAKGKGRGR
ncbi:MAG: hypothetical protein EPO23_00420 [Xanthobacteraceae bacterium]|nr:MAG: hypothetical protein EPO23_00420 [Xanthobacteraceae bacterium]